MTAQVFHSLGFYWARESGMYDIEQDSETSIPELSEPADVLEQKWRQWAAKETQLRALLGHYILDGLLSDYTGGPTCQRHTAHLLPTPCDDSVFNAPDAPTWAAKMRKAQNKSRDFSKVFHSLFSQHVHIRHLGNSLSMITAAVLMEGLKSLSAERVAPGLLAIGVPSDRDISRALGRLYLFIAQSNYLSDVEKEVSILRWHTVCLHKAVDFNWLCRNLCRKQRVDQRIIGGRKLPALEATAWVSSTRARLGLLHAFSIYGILQRLPADQVQRTYVPIATFSAGIMYCAFLLGGITSTDVPEIESWDSVVLIDLDNTTKDATDDLDASVRQYLNGDFKAQEKRRNILYDVNLFTRTLKNLEQLWGVTRPMHQVLEELSSQCT